MINKFQQGGKQDVIMQFIQGLAQALQADPNQIIQIAQQNPKALEAAVQTYQQTQDMNQAAQAFQQGIQAARHGAKLNYIKSLKHQCADDEELYYYKKGGSIGCGCKKKEGGEIKDENKKKSPIAKFKARNGVKVPDDKKILPTDTVHIQNPKTKKMEVRDLSGKHKQFKKLTKEEYQKQSNDKKNDIDTKGYKKGGKTEKDCGGASIVKKFKAARCGSKIKKHQYGGSLNGIPFMQRGTFKGGVQYRFRRSTNDMNNGYKTHSDQIMMTRDPLGFSTYDNPPILAGRTIYVTPQGNDTIFYTNNDIFNKTPKGDLNQKKAKQKFYQLIKKAPIEGEEYRMTPYWDSNLFNLDAVRNRALKGN